MIFGHRSKNCFHPCHLQSAAVILVQMIACYLMACSTSSGLVARGALCQKSLVPGRLSMTDLLNGNVGMSLSKSGQIVCTYMMISTQYSGSGNLLTEPMFGRLRGEKQNGPNPTDRAKPGVKDHILTDGRGVPLSVVVTAANVNDGPVLPDLLNNYVVVRPRPSTIRPQHLCLDAAFDNAPAHRVVMDENFQGHIAPRKGRDESLVLHPGGKARRWVVERTHAWHDRFRRLVVNWEKSIESRYAFLCLANAMIAYRT